MLRRLFTLVVCLLALTSLGSAMERWTGFCQQGGRQVSMASLGLSTGRFMGSYPGCTVTVYDHGTSNLSTIYSDNSSTPKANPFTADATTGLAFFYALNGAYDVQFSGGSLPSTWTLSDVRLLDLTTPQVIGSLIFASGYPGADWCAQVMAADTALGATPGTILLDNNVSDMSTCSNDIALTASHGIWTTQGGTYVTGARQLKPAGANTYIKGNGWGTIFSYTGSDWAAFIDTEPNTIWSDFQIQYTTSALGGIKIQHVTSASEANNRIRNVRVLSSTYTVGQIGLEMYNTALGDSNYNNVIDIYSFRNDIGVKFLSAVSTNSANRNKVWADCAYHSRCVQVPDGTDNEIHASSTGSCTLGALCAGPAYLVELGGSGGSRGASNNSIFIGAEEQGTNSGPLNLLSGAQVNTFYGMPNDPLALSDTSGVLTNRGSMSGIMYNPMIAGTGAFLGFGGVNSAAAVGLKRNSTSLWCRLGDDSAYCSAFAAGKFQLPFTSTSVLGDAINSTNIFLGTTSDIRHWSAWGNRTAGNLETYDSMVNNSTTDGVTYTSFVSTYGSWVYECQASPTDSLSQCGWYYRAAGTADGKGTQLTGLTNLGLGKFLGGTAPFTAGGGTSGTNALPWSSVYIGNAATNNIQLTGTATSAKVATLPDNTGTIAELNLAQSWTALQTFSSGLKAGASGSTISDSRELIQSSHSCGTTTTCANTANGAVREVYGTVTLSTGTATVSSITTFTSTSTFGCSCTDQTAANACKAVPASATSVSFAGTGSDVLFYRCVGN